MIAATNGGGYKINCGLKAAYLPSLRLRKNFVISSTIAGTRAKPMITLHSRKLGKCVLKIGCRKGTLTTNINKIIDTATAYCMYLFENTAKLEDG